MFNPRVTISVSLRVEIYGKISPTDWKLSFMEVDNLMEWVIFKINLILRNLEGIAWNASK